jgi:hypothetical protein
LSAFLSRPFYFFWQLIESFGAELVHREHNVAAKCHKKEQAVILLQWGTNCHQVADYLELRSGASNRVQVFNSDTLSASIIVISLTLIAEKPLN